MRDFIDNDNGEYVPLRERNCFYLIELIFGAPPNDPSSRWPFNAWEVIASTPVMNLESVDLIKKECHFTHLQLHCVINCNICAFTFEIVFLCL